MRVASIGGFNRVKEPGTRGRKEDVFDHDLYRIEEGQAVDLTEDIASLLGCDIDAIDPDAIVGHKKIEALVSKTRARVARVNDHPLTASGGYSVVGTSDLVSWDDPEEGTRYGITVV